MSEDEIRKINEKVLAIARAAEAERAEAVNLEASQGIQYLDSDPKDALIAKMVEALRDIEETLERSCGDPNYCRGMVPPVDDTWCPNCRALQIVRDVLSDSAIQGALLEREELLEKQRIATTANMKFPLPCGHRAANLETFNTSVAEVDTRCVVCAEMEEMQKRVKYWQEQCDLYTRAAEDAGYVFFIGKSGVKAAHNLELRAQIDAINQSEEKREREELLADCRRLELLMALHFTDRERIDEMGGR